MNSTTLQAFRDELVKIAEMDPEMMELQEQHFQGMPQHWNDETTKQFLLDTGLIAAGTGLGYGAGKLTLQALKSMDVPPAVQTALRFGAPLVGGVGAIALRNAMRAEANRRMTEATERGTIDPRVAMP